MFAFYEPIRLDPRKLYQYAPTNLELGSGDVTELHRLLPWNTYDGATARFLVTEVTHAHRQLCRLTVLEVPVAGWPNLATIVTLHDTLMRYTGIGQPLVYYDGISYGYSVREVSGAVRKLR